jgi:hypothetical protein
MELDKMTLELLLQSGSHEEHRRLLAPARSAGVPAIARSVPACAFLFRPKRRARVCKCSFHQIMAPKDIQDSHNSTDWSITLVICCNFECSRMLAAVYDAQKMRTFDM